MSDYRYSPSTDSYFKIGPNNQPVPVSKDEVPAAWHKKLDTWKTKQDQAAKEAAAPDFFGRVNEAAGAGAERLGNMIGPRTGAVAGAVTRGVLPDSNIQAGIDAAMAGSMFTGVGEAVEGAEGVAKALPPTARAIGRFATRLAIPAAGGAVGGATEGKAGKGALQGAGEQMVGEGLSGIFQRGKRTIQKTDLSRLSNWINKNLPAKVSNTIEGFDKAFRGGQLEKDVGKSLEQTNEEIADKIASTAEPVKPKVFGSRKVSTYAPTRDAAIADSPSRIITPSGEQPAAALAPKTPTRVENGMIHVQLPEAAAARHGSSSLSAPFADVNDKISQVLQLGYDMHGDPSTREAGRAMRSAAHQMVEDVGDALNAHEEGLGDKWKQARQQYATAKVMTRMLREDGALDLRTGMLDMEKLHQLTAQAGNLGYREDIGRTMGDKAENFIDTVFRDAAPVKSDLKGQFPIGRAYAHGARIGLPVHMPHLARHVGDVPYDLGRGKALSAVLTLGPYKFAQTINNLINGPQSLEPPAPRTEIGRRP